MNQAYRLLASVRRNLTRQQYRTIRGQIRAGDVDGAVRGIKRMMEENTKATLIDRDAIDFSGTVRG